MEGAIQKSEELEFAVFCIESIARRLGKDPEQVFRALTEKSSILSSYIVPEYEMLHTQNKDYIVEDILDLMEERGVEV